VFDVVIAGGEVVDGTGAARRKADVGIAGGRIAAIGEIAAPATRTIDATGKLVTPGFIDVHTHFDAQVFWDRALTPSPLHGVTTAVAGNCGFTIAPLSADPSDGEYLMRMLARVEGMPLETLRAGVPWNWTSTAEYFAQVDQGIGINLGFMIGHSALRRVVMGPDATLRPSTPEELAAMAHLLRAGLEAGGMGFSTSWARTHNDSDGRMVPSRYATRDELVALAAVVGEYPGTGLEIIPQVGPVFDDWAVELMADMSVAAGRPINWNVLTASAANAESTAAKLAASDRAREKGGRVVALTMPINLTTRLSFAGGFVLDAMPGWEGPMLLPRAEKLALFRDPEARARLQRDAQRPDNPMLGIASWGDKVIYDVVAPENEQYRGRWVRDIAEEQGRDPWDVLCDIAVADELLTSFGNPSAMGSDADWEARVEVWRDERTIIGASDAGAHFDLFTTAHYATGLLQEAVRNRNLLSFEEAVHLLTQRQAELYGFRERGLLCEGWHADVVVIDPATVGADDPTMRFDLPGGAGRLYAGSHGVEHVLVNGSPIVTDGELTVERPGALLRSGRDTADPSMG
jgi:N-acyl-D-aspartate/D-glutamate deacylase